MPAYQTLVIGVHEGMPAKSIQLTASLACESGAKLVLVAAYRAHGATNTFEVAEPAKNALEKAAIMCAEFGHDEVETYAVAGDPVTALTDAVSEHNADLLVVGSRGLAGLRDRLLGSVPGNLTRQAECDVLVVHTTGTRYASRRRADREHRRTIVVGVHDSTRSMRAAERAGAIAADFHADLVLVGAYEDMDWRELKRARDTLGAESHLVHGTFPIESALRDGEARACARGAREVERVVVYGDAMKALFKIVDKRRADVLVLGNHQLTGRMSHLIGSISEQASRKTDTHILLVH